MRKALTDEITAWLQDPGHYPGLSYVVNRIALADWFMRKPFDAAPMKLLLSSADRRQIERFARILFVAGVPSEIRESRVGQNSNLMISGAELWIQDDGDYQTAIKLFSDSTQPPQAA